MSKIAMTPPGIEPATFRFVAQHLNHCATAVPEIEGIDRLLRESSDESDRIPESLYVQRKLRDDKTTDDVAYELRPRRVGRSRPEPDKDKSNIETSEEAGNGLVQPSTSPSKNIPELTHSYNLRTRVGTTKTKLNSVALVRERTIPTERPPPVGEVSANFCG